MEAGGATLRIVLVLYRSGSMSSESPSRIERLLQGECRCIAP